MATRDEQQKARGITLNQSVLNAVNRQLPGGPADRPPLTQIRQQAVTGREAMGLRTTAARPRQTLDDSVQAVVNRFYPAAPSSIQPPATPATNQGLVQNSFNVPGDYSGRVNQLGVSGLDSRNFETRGPATLRPGAPLPGAMLLGHSTQPNATHGIQQFSNVPTVENFSGPRGFTLEQARGLTDRGQPGGGLSVIGGRSPEMQAAVSERVADINRQIEQVKRDRDPYFQATGYTQEELRQRQQQRFLEQRALGTDAIGEERPFMGSEGVGSMPSAVPALRENQLLEQAARSQRQEQALGLLGQQRDIEGGLQQEQLRQAGSLQQEQLRQAGGLQQTELQTQAQREAIRQRAEEALAQQALGARELDTRRELGLLESGSRERELGISESLGQRGLDLEQQGLQQTGELGRMQQAFLREELAQRGITDRAAQDIAIADLLQRGELGQRGLDISQQELTQRGTLAGEQRALDERRLAQEGRLTERGQDLQRTLGLREADIAQQSLQQRGELGQTDLQLRRQEIAQRGELGRTELTQNEAFRRDELVQRGELGRAELTQRGQELQQRGELSRAELAQRGELGRGDLAIKRQQIKQLQNAGQVEQEYKKMLLERKQTPFEETLDRERAKGLVQRQQSRREEVKTANRMLQQLDILEDLNDISGFGANQWAGVTRAASAVGIGQGEYASRLEAFKSIRSELAGNLTKQLAGPLSEKELSFIVQQPPNETNTMAGNQMIIDNLRLITLTKLAGLDSDADLDLVQSGNDVGTRLRTAMQNDPVMTDKNIVETMRETGMSINDVLLAGGY